MLPEHTAIARDHQHAALLQRVALGSALPKSPPQSADRASYGSDREDGAQPRPQLGGSIHSQRRVGVERAIVPGRLPKPGDESRRAITDDVELGARGVQALQVAMQLHRVLSAVQSTKVADEHEHGGPVTPQRMQRDGRAELVQDRQRADRLRPLHVSLGATWTAMVRTIDSRPSDYA